MEGLRRSFHELYKEFTRQGKHEHRKERVFLLDELYSRSLGSGIELAGEDKRRKMKHVKES